MTSLASGAARMHPIASLFSLTRGPRTLAHAGSDAKRANGDAHFRVRADERFRAAQYSIRRSLIFRFYLSARASAARSMRMRCTSRGNPKATAHTSAVEARSLR